MSRSQARNLLLFAVLACSCVDLATPVGLRPEADGGQGHDVSVEAAQPDRPTVIPDGPDLTPDASADTTDMTDTTGIVDGPDDPQPAIDTGGSIPDAGGTTMDVAPDVAPPPPDLAPDLAPEAPPPPPNQPPTVAVAAAANPSPIAGTMTTLSVLGADDQGEPGLLYTWSPSGSPPGVVAFSDNGTNSAKTATAIFTAAGSYLLNVAIRDGGGLVTSSSVAVQVNQTANDIAIMPTMVTLAAGGTQMFVASVFDQFGALMAAQGTVTWSLAGGACGTVSAAGAFSATIGASTTCVLTGASGAVSDTASIAVGGAPPILLAPIADAHTEEGNSDKNFGTATALLVKTQSSSTNARRGYLKFSLAGTGTPVTSAILRLYGGSDSDSNTVAATGVLDTSWSETGITWKNAPALGSSLATVGITTTRKYRDWDVTAYVRAQQSAGSPMLSLGLLMTGSDQNPPDSFNSREASSNPPQLVLTH